MGWIGADQLVWEIRQFKSQLEAQRQVITKQNFLAKINVEFVDI